MNPYKKFPNLFEFVCFCRLRCCPLVSEKVELVRPVLDLANETVYPGEQVWSEVGGHKTLLLDSGFSFSSCSCRLGLKIWRRALSLNWTVMVRQLLFWLCSSLRGRQLNFESEAAVAVACLRWLFVGRKELAQSQQRRTCRFQFGLISFLPSRHRRSPMIVLHKVVSSRLLYWQIRFGFLLAGSATKVCIIFLDFVQIPFSWLAKGTVFDLAQG